jgi:hypothetical protein
MHVTDKSIVHHLKSISEQRLNDILIIVEMMEKITQRKPEMWGTIIGFGSLHYVYKTGHSGDMPILGLANRKQAITLYLSSEIGKFNLLGNLGKHTIGVGCLYIKKLSDINLNILEQLMQKAFDDLKN